MLFKIRFKTAFFLIMLGVGLLIFVLSLLPFFRELSDMMWIMSAVGAAAITGAVFGLTFSPKKKKQVKLNSKYERKDALMTAPEIEFYRLLKEIDPDKYEVVPQVALVNVIDKKTNTSYRNELFRVCDFCFVDRVTYEPLLLVELNDRSHDRADRRERDEKVAAICDDAGLPLLTFRMSDDLSYNKVRRAVNREILK